MGLRRAGDRYLLKLFRDFVFHQSREDGSPVLDWGHVVECLNKLDAGLPEKVRCARARHFPQPVILPLPTQPCMRPCCSRALAHSCHRRSHNARTGFLDRGLP